jgi:MoaA/NifB/PqqE/SkfB family radical SAM enzyme
MNIKEKFMLGASFASALLFNRRKPIFVGWAITKRCNLRCLYCSAWKNTSPELKTSQILEIINILASMGSRMIRFTGGEPLLREDIATIINYSGGLGLLNTISTNGFLFSERADEIKKLHGVSISLDGPAQIHDSIRGTGSYLKALEALDKAKKKNISTSIAVALSSYNLHCIEYLLKTAEIFNARIFFQPAIKTILYCEDHNPISPNANEYKNAISYLMELKPKNKYIGNSMAGLKHLYNWPTKKPIHCMAGKIICRLDPQGNVYPCSRFDIKNNTLNIKEGGAKHCFQKLYSPNCGNCWCSSMVELNLISDLNINALFNSIKI